MTTAVEIPLPSDPPPYFDQRAVLGGVEFLLRFSWAGRCERWTLGLYDANEQPISTGWVLVTGLPFTYRIRDERAPRGEIMLVGRVPNTLESLGDGSCSLMYVEAE